MTIVPPLVMKHHACFSAPRCALPEGERSEGSGDRVSLGEFHVKGKDGMSTNSCVSTTAFSPELVDGSARTVVGFDSSSKKPEPREAQINPSSKQD